MTTETVPIEGYVRIRGLRGEQIVTAKAWRSIYSQKGEFEYIGPAEKSDLERVQVPRDEEPDRNLLERRGRLRGKTPVQIAKMANGDADEARLLFEAEMSAGNRQDVLEALTEIIDGAA